MDIISRVVALLGAVVAALAAGVGLVARGAGMGQSERAGSEQRQQQRCPEQREKSSYAKHVKPSVW
jgi:hypothetical protein